MSVNLVKGQKVDLTKGNAGLRNVMIGLGWDQARTRLGGGISGQLKSQPLANKCNATVILCGSNGRVLSSDAIVYYGALKHPSGAIVHQGDNLTGAGDGDDEQIMVDLARIPSNIDKMVFVVNIYDANVRHQHFGMIRNAFIRLVDMSTGREICHYNLSDNYNNMTGLIVGEIYRYNGEWKFNAIGQPVAQASRVTALLDMYR